MILNIPVSYYRNIGDTSGVSVFLDVLLTRPRPEHIELISRVRSATSQEEKKERKSLLPLFAPSAQLKSRGARIPLKEKIIGYSGFMQFDIDLKDNPGMRAEQVRDTIITIPYVAYAALSASGQGTWGLVRVASPESLDKHFTHFRNMVESRTNIKLDATKGSNPTGLRYISYDPDARFNLDASSLPLPRERPIKPPPIRLSLGDGNYDDVSLLVKAVLDRRIDLLDDYPTWFAVGSGFARELGEYGRDLFHALSQLNQKYDYHRTDKDYSLWMKYSNNKGQLGAFFNVCKRHGLSINDLKRDIYKTTLGRFPRSHPSPAAYPKPALPPLSVDATKADYDSRLIDDLLRRPNHYTSLEAVSKIISNVPMAGWFHALTDYLTAMQHPDPKIAAKAYLKTIDQYKNGP